MGYEFRRMAQGRIARFGRDEDGVLIVFGLVLFLLMTMLGGLAVDLVRYENTRAELQQAVDRCTLAAASLDQRLDPETVVRDCMTKAGLGNTITGITVVNSSNDRTVTTRATANANPFFTHMLGIDQMVAAGAATASQAVNNIEIVLVLDISGSMDGTKIANLRTAAQEFVDTVLTGNTDRISIAIVPYNGAVNIGARLKSKYTVIDDPNFPLADCVTIPDAEYANRSLSRTLQLPAVGRVDGWTGTSGTTGYVAYTDPGAGAVINANSMCEASSANAITLPSNNITALQARIGQLTANGWTSIHLGMKWGLTLLDPGTRGIVNEFVASGEIPAVFRDRPADYTSRSTHKIIVLMTDGENTVEEFLRPAFRSGMSPIYRSTADGFLTIQHANRPSPNFWVPHLGQWRTAPYSNGGVTQQRWIDVWPQARVSWVAWQLYARALGNNVNARNNIYNQTMAAMLNDKSAATMDTQLQQVCGLAKAEGVTIYGIAFEAPTNGQAQISACSTSPAHYYNAQGLGIRAAFRSIASNLSNLKLTQ